MDEKEMLQATVRFMLHFRRTVHEGFADAMADTPRCHFAMLERIHWAIEGQAKGGCCGRGAPKAPGGPDAPPDSISVSLLAAHHKASLPAVSRDLRMLEAEGYIARTPDPQDRRKTLVRLTEKGEAARRRGEEAAGAYLRGVMARLGEENHARMLRDWQLLEEAMQAETEARRAAAPSKRKTAASACQSGRSQEEEPRDD